MKNTEKALFYSVQNLKKWRESYFIVFYIVYAHANLRSKKPVSPPSNGRGGRGDYFFPAPPYTFPQKEK